MLKIDIGLEYLKLINNLKNISGHTIYDRGLNYYNSGYVKKIKISLDNSMKCSKIEGDVEGSL